ncbi:maltose acetyltransferase domain-containing protein, partial [Streptomyces sp. ZEA17I]|uniref:maltose acetyltransferase domain-containing protein n=1 Tax=Streptomyces sp. ZEA17I TaxID=2202516 RepID=UPI002810F649
MTSQNTPDSAEHAATGSPGAEGAARSAPRSQREAMLAGELYLADDPEIAADALRSALLTEHFNA